MYRGLAAFFACTTLILAAVLAWLAVPQLWHPIDQTPFDQDIVFPLKVFVGTKAYVGAKGTLRADWIGYKNNTYSILCTPEECIVADVEQIGPKLMSSIDGPVTYPIKRWTDDHEVIAEEDALCARITITLDRKTETVLWVETPINQTELACKNADNNIRKATLEDSLYWHGGTSDTSLKQRG
jgi:hypothetical protein